MFADALIYCVILLPCVCVSLLQYFGTMLPRIPVPIERKMKVQLLLHGEKKKRAAANESIKGR
jgi:hypothetical protein